MHGNELERARRLVIGRLESLQRAGVLQLPKAKQRIEPSVDAAPGLEELPAAEATLSPAASRKGWQPQAGGALFEAKPAATPDSQTSSAPSLQILQHEVAGCTRCGELARTRTQTVFGVGNPNARLCFIGEAPGADEDRLGEPFVGRAGQLLTKIIEACRMKREDVYILNMIKCRPPGNRNPLPEELANCRGYLERQLALIRPEFICCLGTTASQLLLKSDETIGKLRGRFHDY